MYKRQAFAVKAAVPASVGAVPARSPGPGHIKGEGPLPAFPGESPTSGPVKVAR